MHKDADQHSAGGAGAFAMSARKRGGAAKRSEDIYERPKVDIASMQVKL